MDIVWSLLGKAAGLVGDVFATIVTPFVAAFAYLLIWSIGWLLMLTANIFNALVHWTIVDFGGTLRKFGIDQGIDLVWTAFRDLSNIVIIGMFVFVAISMILGNANYGTRRFVVRILIIAVLINFSLLFTKIMIDVSHIAARQFYQGMIAQTNTTTNGGSANISGLGTSGLQGSYGDVAGAFLNRAGLTSGFDTYTMLLRVAGGAGIGMKGLFVMFTYALTMAAFMLGLIVSFAFAIYLLASRALLLIFLMLVSSLAFAAFLIPKYGESKDFGFTAWWDAVLKNALFAPLIMMFMWASLTIVRPRQGTTGTLGAFFDKPGDPANWGALMAYIFAAGMLFLSVKFSSKFAGSIPHFNIAQNVVGKMGMFGAGAAALLGRQTVGRAAYGLATGKTGALLATRERQSTSDVEKFAARLGRQTLSKIGSGSFNATKVPFKPKDVVSGFSKSLGFGDGKGGFAGVVKSKKDDKKKDETARDDTIKNYIEKSKSSSSDRDKIISEEREAIAKQRAAEDSKRTSHDKIVEQQKDLMKSVTTQLSRLNDAHARGGGSFSDKARTVPIGENGAAAAQRQKLAEQLRGAEAIIDTARRASVDASAKVIALEQDALKKADKRIKDLDNVKMAEAMKGLGLSLSEIVQEFKKFAQKDQEGRRKKRWDDDKKKYGGDSDSGGGSKGGGGGPPPGPAPTGGGTTKK